METTRIELFEMVWETPMIHLAKKLNLSDVGLRKICKKQGIPLPRSGHWTRKQLGKEDARPELPYPNHNPAINLPDEVQAEQNRSQGASVKAAKNRQSSPNFEPLNNCTTYAALKLQKISRRTSKPLRKRQGRVLSLS